MALWGARFGQEPAEAVVALSRSVQFDWRLAPYDVRVNIAHLKELTRIGVIDAEKSVKILAALLQLQEEIQSGRFVFTEEDEDVHSAVERGLIAKVGTIGSSIRAGRSRNDLVITDFKLYLIDHLIDVSYLVHELVNALNVQAIFHSESIAPGFTHLQHAQPINFGHELAKHSHALLRDIDRIKDWLQRSCHSPFGAGALSGSAMQPEPSNTAHELGFADALGNSIDAVSDRDFVAEALFILAMIGIHLSRIGEEFTLWSSSEFGWAKIADAYSTGSSIMPQKRNPDIAELARGKSGRLIGNLTAVLAMLKGLPFAYNRDLQEDKEPVFDSVETLQMLLPAVIGMIESTQFNSEKMAAGATAGYSLATEIADFLAKKGIPFSQAHDAAGKCVKQCESLGIELDQLSDDQFLLIHPDLTAEVRERLTAVGAVSSRTSKMGTSTRSLIDQIANLNSQNSLASIWISSERDRFSGMMKA
jgi:argininosuccinate lyase